MASKIVHWEDREQAALFEWAAYYPTLKFMHAIPNGAHLAGNKLQRAKQMKRLKKQGLKPGVLDVFLPVPRPPYHGMYIEMKRPDGKGTVSVDQQKFGDEMMKQGYKVVFCNGFQQAADAITEYMAL